MPLLSTSIKGKNPGTKLKSSAVPHTRSGQDGGVGGRCRKQGRGARLGTKWRSRHVHMKFTNKRRGGMAGAYEKQARGKIVSEFAERKMPAWEKRNTGRKIFAKNPRNEIGFPPESETIIGKSRYAKLILTPTTTDVWNQ